MTRLRKKTLLIILAAAFGCCLVVPAFADDGMWTFDNPPTKLLQEKYNFTPTQEWLDHIRLSSVRFNDGGSGSFVSPNGLVLTNHHVALGQLQKMSSKDKDYVADGFYAKTQAEEIKCTDLELNVLISMENVTARMQTAVKPGMTEKEAYDAQKEEIAKITKESLEKTGLRSDVVAFYQGSEHWLYRYKKYTDVRLVMAPEQQIAYFGGDPDNFTYPRYDLDMTLFRVYENDKPVQPVHYLKWNSKGAQDGELVFVSGHPGSTNRLQTAAQLEYLRDYSYPLRFKVFQRRLAVLKNYSKLGPEQERRALNQIFGLENTLKASRGEYQGLLDIGLMKKKRKEDNDLRSLVDGKPEWKKVYGDAWDSIIVVIDRSRKMVTPNTYRALRGSRLAALAVQIVEYVTEVTKPNEKRFTEFQDANLASLEFRMFSRAPIYTDMDELRHTVIRVVRTSTGEVNRRQHERYPVNLGCRVSVAGGGRCVLRVDNLSADGAALSGDPRLAVGTRGTLELDGIAMTLPFIVRSADDRTMHLAFELAAASTAKLAETLGRLASQRAA